MGACRLIMAAVICWINGGRAICAGTLKVMSFLKIRYWNGRSKGNLQPIPSPVLCVASGSLYQGAGHIAPTNTEKQASERKMRSSTRIPPKQGWHRHELVITKPLFTRVYGHKTRRAKGKKSLVRPVLCSCFVTIRGGLRCKTIVFTCKKILYLSKTWIHIFHQ